MNKYETLLKQWCDSLVNLQIKGFGQPHDGGILCPACTTLHGRADNAVFPLVYTYKLTGDEKYIKSAETLFKWQERLINPDGSCYNDGNNGWKGITVFSCIGYCKTVKYLSNALDDNFKIAIIHRIEAQAEWIYNYVGINYHSNINYYAAAASAMALCGELFGEEKYFVRSREMLDYCMRHFTENGLLMGEGQPHNGATERGCRFVDIGYNFEESIPCLTDAAEILNDENTLKTLAHNVLKTLDIFMPDGAMDNTFGTRNNKWTYYGSRTSDGCVASLLILSEYAPQLKEAALRNMELQMQCTHNGLLYGGRQYFEAGQKPCSHHTICHAVGLADALIAGLSESIERQELLSDKYEFSFKYYPEVETYKIWAGDWLATVTACDNQPSKVGSGGVHPSGGTVSLLYHKPSGPVIAGSTYTYKLGEPLNMQLPNELLYPHRTLIPRAEYVENGTIYASCLDNKAEMTAEVGDLSVTVASISTLTAINGTVTEKPVKMTAEYVFKNDGVCFKLHFDNADGVRYIIPLIGDIFLKTENKYSKQKIFYLGGGFIADEYCLLPDGNGDIHLKLSKSQSVKC
ncbi:MAG: hypothetical protein J6S13_09940 [Clostridia bacterium]|nr:hypothetical protein [Clostridia bacterium]